MNQILKVESFTALIGMEDGSVVEVDIRNMDFVPQVGDKVRVYTYEDEIFVRKVEKSNIEDITKDQSGIYNIDKSGIYDLEEYYYEPEPGKALVNKWIYVALAFLTGTFGVHKFYSKKIGMGVLYFLFFWTGIPSIVGIIEGILAVIKTSDLNGNILI